MSNQPLLTKVEPAVQTAVIRFLKNGSMEVKLSGSAGMTARMLDNVSVHLYNELNRLRALDRVKNRQARLKAEEETRKAAEEAAKQTEEVKS